MLRAHRLLSRERGPSRPASGDAALCRAGTAAVTTMISIHLSAPLAVRTPFHPPENHDHNLRPPNASPPPWSPAGRTRALGGFGILQGLAWAQWVCSAMRNSATRTRALLAALVVGPLRGLAVLMLTNSGQIIRWSLVRGSRPRMVHAVSSPCNFTCRRQCWSG